MVTFSVTIVDDQDENIISVHASRPGHPGEVIELEVHQDELEWFRKMGATDLTKEDK